MSKGTIIAVVVASIVAGLVLGVTGTAAVGFVGRTLMRPAARFGQADIAAAPQAQGFAGQGRMMGRGGAAGQGGMMGGQRGTMGGQRGMMGQRGAQGGPGAQNAPRYGDPDGAGPLTCPDCGQNATGTLTPPWQR